MDDYRHTDFETEPLERRYPNWPWLRGVFEWQQGARNFPFRAIDDALAWIDAIRNTPPKEVPSPCPRVFVSHRQIDHDAAMRVAWLASDEHLDYWLDVIDLDPVRNRQVAALQRRLGRALLPLEKAVLIGAIIEMALLNCSDVIALMTRATAGSQWVPYEYGRIKEDSLLSRHASAWHDHTSLPMSDLAEYLHLAEIHRDEAEIRAWYQRVLIPFPACAGRVGWQGGVPPALPTG